jgi:hypothetical protein
MKREQKNKKKAVRNANEDVQRCVRNATKVTMKKDVKNASKDVQRCVTKELMNYLRKVMRKRRNV